jgi:hypothetical protein
VQDHEFARLLFLRQQEIERRLRSREAVEARQHEPRHSVRRLIGLRLIDLGSAIASDGPLKERPC